MEINEVKYCIVDKNNNFVSYDSETEMLFGSKYIGGDIYANENLTRIKDACFNLEQEYLDGEIGKVSVEFPLRPLKITTLHIIEEVV